MRCGAMRILSLYTHALSFYFFPTVYSCFIYFWPHENCVCNWFFVGVLQIFSLETSNNLKTHTDYVCVSAMRESTHLSSVANALTDNIRTLSMETYSPKFHFFSYGALYWTLPPIWFENDISSIFTKYNMFKSLKIIIIFLFLSFGILESTIPL